MRECRKIPPLFLSKLLNGHIQETIGCANAAKSRRNLLVSSMLGLPNGHIQETI
jgi:hypothetical protein